MRDLKPAKDAKGGVAASIEATGSWTAIVGSWTAIVSSWTDRTRQGS